MSFQECLEFGHIYEKKLMEFIPYDSYIIREGLFSAYDVKVNYMGDKIRYEVKADRMAHKTGNMVIEFESNGVPSGISVTRARYYAYFVVKPYDLFDLYVIPVKVIKQYIMDSKYKRILKGGNKQLSHMYVFAIDTFKEYLLHSN